MTWFATILFVVLTFGHLSEAKHAQRLKSAVVVGKVYCDTCFQANFDKSSHFISGASVAIECRYGASSRPIFREEAKTDKNGEFKIRLPFSVSKHVKRIEGCSVALISSGEPYCAVASTATSSSSFRLKSRRHGTHIFSAGFFTFKPLNQPTVCNQKPSLKSSNNSPKETASLEQNPNLTFPPPLKDPNTPGDLPPLPSLPIPNLPPLPSLPPLPPLPRLPLLPSLPGNLPPLISGSQKFKSASKRSFNHQNGPKVTNPRPSLPHVKKNDQRVDTQDFFFPPNPLQPPPLIPNPFQPPSPLIPNPFQPPPPLIPNPFQPSPPPLFPNPFQPSPPPLFPNPFQPPPAPTPFFHFPPIPGLTPSPPPPPPTFPFPFPPFPFVPPRSPGAPPASSP